MSDEPSEAKIQIDSDWKEEARREKERLTEQEAGAKARGPLASASFLELVNMVAMQAIVSLGGYQLPTGERVPVDLDMAKHQIDLLEMLDKKTAGNLSEEEQKALASVLYELRMQYVQVARAPKR